MAPLQVVYAGDTLVLRVGDRRQLRGDAQLEVFLSKSFYTRPGATPPLEGEPYVVELMIFRRN
ncbi:MAG TPA: hypothetical protein VEX86_08685 [Longimicrobium sp.]|nr:hypothetical protein [Longimicrobium sp.]